DMIGFDIAVNIRYPRTRCGDVFRSIDRCGEQQQVPMEYTGNKIDCEIDVVSVDLSDGREMVFIDVRWRVTLAAEDLHGFGECHRFTVRALHIARERVKQASENILFVHDWRILTSRVTWVSVDVREKGDALTVPLQLGRHSMSDNASERPAEKVIRTRRLDHADLVDIVSRHLLDRGGTRLRSSQA